MQQGYYSRAWNDIKNSPGWFGKLCLLALLDFIPIFGPIVAYGYLGGWARDIAWGVKSPLPARIFGNEDGKLYRRGWFVFAALFIYAAIAWALTSLLMGFADAAAGGAAGAYGNGRMAPASAGFDALGFVMGVLAFVVAIAIVFFALAGTARSVIYDRFSPAFQISTLWKMIKHDASGIVRILLMALVVGLIIGIAVFCAIFVVIFLSIFIGIFTGGPAFMNMMSGSYDDLAYGYGYGYGYGSSDAAFLSFLQSILPVLGLGILLLVAVCYLAVVGQMFITALVFRAMGYWTQGFEVAKWGGQDAPLPFEVEQARAQAAAAAAWQAQQQAAQPAVQQPAQQPANAQQPVGTQQPAAPAPEAAGQPASQPQQPAAPAPVPVQPAPVQSQPAAPAPESPAPAVEAPQQPAAPVAPQAPAMPASEAPASPADSAKPAADDPAPSASNDPAKPSSDDGASK